MSLSKINHFDMNPFILMRENTCNFFRRAPFPSHFDIVYFVPIFSTGSIASVPSRIYFHITLITQDLSVAVRNVHR